MNLLIQEFNTSRTQILCITIHKGYLYSAGNDTIIRKWDSNGKCIQVLNMHEDWIRCLFSDGDYFYSGSNDCIIIQWKDDEYIKKLTFSAYVFSIIKYNGYLYVAGCCDVIKKYDDNGECIQILKEHTNYIWKLVTYNDYMYSCSSDGYIKKWNKEGRCIQTFQNYNEPIFELIVYRNYLLSSDNNYIGQWDENGNCIFTHHKPNYSIRGCAFYNSEVYFACISGYGCIKIWNNGIPISIIKNYYDTPDCIIIHDNYIYVTYLNGYIKNMVNIIQTNTNYFQKKQKEKIQNWNGVWKHCNIQKDLALVFARELLL